MSLENFKHASIARPCNKIQEIVTRKHEQPKTVLASYVVNIMLKTLARLLRAGIKNLLNGTASSHTSDTVEQLSKFS